MRLIYFKILISILAIILLSLLITTAFIIAFTRKDLDANLKERLFANAQIAAELVKSSGYGEDNAKILDGIVKRLGEKLKLRITIIRKDGIVSADSSHDPAKMENHLLRPEVQTALSGGTGMSTRLSPTLGIPMTYLAIPLDDGDKRIGVTRVALPQARIREKIYHAIYRSVLFGALIGAIAAAAISLFVARRYSRPIKLIKDAARNISDGDFSYRLKLKRKDELSQLSESLNEMSEKLGHYFESVNKEKERILAIVGGMSEALMLIGADDSIYLANDAFCGLFGLEKHSIVGRPYWEVILVEEVSQFVRAALESKKPEYSECAIRGSHQKLKYYQTSSSPIISEKGHFRGIVLMFHDVTPMKETEKIRREFVDNVSHELKTPISTVIATAETLIGKEPTDAETRKRFYNTIFENTHRLNTLVNDILALSEIEHKKASLELTLEDIADIVKTVVQNFSEPIKNKGQDIKLHIPGNLPSANVDRKTLSRALGNMLDNAIKYTDEGGLISVDVQKEKNFLRIDIKDNGIGISPEHVERIFERFYRVDKARSIKSGGTGLGLAVAKHIIEAHRGKIEVSSSPGKGSKFSVFLPA
jgi:two-component system phosphate regulon sensor histidine kinase PhoR